MNIALARQAEFGGNSDGCYVKTHLRVTSGVFTREAETFASRNSVYLIDGRRLEAMIRAVQSGPVAVPHMQPSQPPPPT